VPVIATRTLTREFRLHVDCRRAARVLAYIEARPEISGATFETVDLVVHRVGNFYRIALPDGVIAEGTALHLLDAMHRVTICSFIDEVPGAPLIHAASIRVGGSSMLLIGDKGVGKTTLALYLIERGYIVEGDEHVAVREGDLMARPRTLRVKADSSRFVPKLVDKVHNSPAVEEWNGSAIYAVSPSIGGNSWRIAPFSASHLVFLEPNYGGHSVARTISAERALSRLLKQSLLPDPRGPAAARLRNVARQAKAWEMSLGDLAGAERHLNQIASSVKFNH
jgi:hypothetical protein